MVDILISTPPSVVVSTAPGAPQIDLLVESDSTVVSVAVGAPGLPQTVSAASVEVPVPVSDPSLSTALALELAHNSIRTAFSDLMNGGHGGVPILYDNEFEEPPTSGRWVRFRVSDSFGEQTRFGGKIHRRQYGDAIASIYTPAGEGNGDALEIVNDIKGIFKDTTVGSCTFLQPSLEKVGLEQRWWRIDLVCPFYFDVEEDLPTFSQSEGLPTMEEIQNVIRQHFKEEFADVQSISVQYDNAHFEPPDSEPWVRLSILGGSTLRTESGRYRTTGVIDASIFTPVGIGDQRALSLADLITNVFKPSTVHGVKFRLPSVSSVGTSGRYWQVTVSCPFLVNEV